MSNKLSKTCFWKLEHFPWRIIKNRTSRIWNVEYKKPLYAEYVLTLVGLRRRNVYLWNKKFDRSSDFEFGWSFDCRKGDFLLS